ncbi:hypothetical protein QQ045_029035 [Rhodiola kirilowii]
MANDTVLRVALVMLAAGVLLTGFYTHSFSKMMVTYMFGICGIAGVLLPDWTYFNRDFNKWFSPVDLNEDVLQQSHKSVWQKWNIYPLRLIVYATVYWYGVRKWWEIVSR